MANIPLAGAQVVRIAFRLGVLVDDVSRNLQAPQSLTGTDPGASWAYVVPRVVAEEVQKELDTIHAAEVRFRTILRGVWCI